MKNGCYFFLLLYFLLNAFNLINAQSQIYLETVGFTDSTWIYLRDIEKELVIDSGVIISNKLLLNAETKEPTRFVITTDFKNQANFEVKFLWKEDHPIRIWAEQGDLKNARMEGSEIQEQATILYESKAKLYESLDSIQEISMGFYREDKERPTWLKTKEEELMDAMYDLDLIYIEEHPDHLVSVFTLTFLMRNITKEKAKELFENLSPEMQQTKYGLVVQQYLVLSMNLKTGDKAKDFQLPDLDGNTISLANFKGNYILLEFWSSNCGPCRMENPNLLENYKSYSSQGFEIISISLDKQRENWEKAVQKDNMIWTTACDLQGYNGSVVAVYNIKYVPRNYLIDPAGIIIAEDLRGEELGAKLNEIFSGEANE